MNRSLRVTLFGNVNNEMYRFAVALKQQGVLVKLVSIDEGKLHDPSSINLESLDVNAEILNTGLLEVELLSLSSFFRRIVIRETSQSDFAIFTGATIAFANFAKSPYALFLSGSDAVLMTSYKLPSIRVNASAKKLRGFSRYYLPMLLYVYLQRKSIRRAKFWLALPEDAFIELGALKSELNCQGIFQTFLPVVLDHQRNNFPIEPSNLIKVSMVSRFSIKQGNLSTSSLDDKGSAIALAGLLRFALVNPGLIEFSYFAKGEISEDCLSLIKDLKKNCMVVKKSELSFDQFLVELNSSEVVIDSVGASPVARNSIEALSLGKFVIGNFRSYNPLQELSNYKTYRVLTHSAVSSTDVFNGLEIYKQNRNYFLENSQDFASEISKAFSPMSQGGKLTEIIKSYIDSDY